MNVTYRLGYTAYYKWSSRGSCLSTVITAFSLEDLKARVLNFKKTIFKKPYQFKSVEFADSIEVSFHDLIPVEAITRKVVRKPKKK